MCARAATARARCASPPRAHAAPRHGAPALPLCSLIHAARRAPTPRLGAKLAICALPVYRTPRAPHPSPCAARRTPHAAQAARACEPCAHAMRTGRMRAARQRRRARAREPARWRAASCTKGRPPLLTRRPPLRIAHPMRPHCRPPSGPLHRSTDRPLVLECLGGGAQRRARGPSSASDINKDLCASGRQPRRGARCLGRLGPKRAVASKNRAGRLAEVLGQRAIQARSADGRETAPTLQHELFEAERGRQARGRPQTRGRAQPPLGPRANGGVVVAVGCGAIARRAAPAAASAHAGRDQLGQLWGARPRELIGEARCLASHGGKGGGLRTSLKHLPRLGSCSGTFALRTSAPLERAARASLVRIWAPS